MPIGDENEGLLARLNALKPSVITSLDPAKPAYSPSPRIGSENSEEDLVTRFGKLGRGDHGSFRGQSFDHKTFVDAARDVEHNEEDDRTIDELLNELGDNEVTWNTEKNERDIVSELLEQARAAIRATRKDAEQEFAHTGGPVKSNDREMRPWDDTASIHEKLTDIPQKHGRDSSERQKVNEYIQLALAEAKIEKQHGSPGSRSRSMSQSGVKDLRAAGPDSHDIAEVDVEMNGRSEDEQEENLMSLPSAPSNMPIIVSTDSPTFLPSAPTFHPSAISLLPKSTTLPRFTDEDIENWCIICNDNATLKCVGCDGDLYCSRCWKEGHLGESAGFEERRHRAVRFEVNKKLHDIG